MGLKYTKQDIDKMVEVFSAINDKKKANDGKGVLDELVKLIDYPVPVLREFLKCMESFSDKDENYLKENYMGVIGYIIIRLNLVNENEEILDF
jgi:hypothetical protein